jgi:hypothetical protein
MAIVGPIAPYSNVPIEPQFYEPRRYEIDDISKGQTTTITTTEDHDFVIGQQVRINLPAVYGMYQINGKQAMVIDIPSDDEVVLNLDSTQFDSFIAANDNQVPQIIPIGEFNSGYISSTGRVVSEINIPGSFINISPE